MRSGNDLPVDGDGHTAGALLHAEVVPRGEWPARVVPDGSRVEVLSAMQGG